MQVCSQRLNESIMFECEHDSIMFISQPFIRERYVRVRECFLYVHYVTGKQSKLFVIQKHVYDKYIANVYKIKTCPFNVQYYTIEFTFPFYFHHIIKCLFRIVYKVSRLLANSNAKESHKRMIAESNLKEVQLMQGLYKTRYLIIRSTTL